MTIPRPARAPLFSALLAFIFVAQALGVPEATYQPVTLSASGLIGDGVALFVPAGLEPAHLPHSFALLKRPKITGALPNTWRDTPTFTCDGPHYRATITVSQDVDLYGGGEVTGPFRRNGTTTRLWNTDNYSYLKDEGKRLYQSHPWILGVRADGTAFGVIFDSTWKAELTCAEAVTFTSQGPAFPVVVIERDTPQNVVKTLADLTGHMPLPPRWALGYQQCRYSYDPDSKVREIADNFRSRQIPCDVIWMDIDYMDAYRIFTFRRDEFPDPKGLNGYLHEKGFHSVWMIDPGVKLDSEYKVYQSGTAADVWVKTSEGLTFTGKVWPGDCVFPDFTRPETRKWWSGLYKDFIAQGVDGVWNDMNEPAVFDTPDWTMPEDNWHRGGGDLVAGPHRRYHNVYGMLMVSATREGILAEQPEKRPFVLTRASFLGGQRYAATWTGDNASKEEHLEMSIPMTLTLGLSGQPFNGPDIGGFAENASPDLWSRWIGLGAFYPFSRGHAVKGSNNKEPWAFGPKVEQTARIALQRRYRLLPYFYTLFREASVTGMPIMRPVFFADPTDTSLRGESQAFMLGNDVLVVPRWAKDPHLPKGDWREVSLVEGDLNDPDQPRVLIRAGSIVPVGKIVQNTNENSFDPLTLLVATDATGTATGQLYDDAGDTFAYSTGNYELTAFHAQTQNGKVTVSAVSREGKFIHTPSKVVIEAIGKDGHVDRQSATLADRH